MKTILLLLSLVCLSNTSLFAQKSPKLKVGEAKALILRSVDLKDELINATGSDGFEQDGYPYSFLPDDMDTRPELDIYLGEVFAPQAIEALIKYYGIIEKNGRLAQVSIPSGGALQDWQNCIVEPINTYDVKDQLAFLCVVNYVGNSGLPPVNYQYEFLYIKKTGWRLLNF